jgi:aminoglycoside phosphotransferase (APT) family kinase protein
MTGAVNGPAPVSPEQAGRLVRAVRPGARLVRAWPLAGAASSQVTGIEADLADGSRFTLVLRQYGAANLRSDPHSAQTEYQLLKQLSEAGLPVPRPYLADESGTIVAGPCLLMELIDGEPVSKPADLPSFTRQFAAALAAVHDCGITRDDVPSLPGIGAQVLAELSSGPHGAGEVMPEAALRQALQANWPPPQLTGPVVLHGDYWPGNVLWRGGQLTGIIDWEDAAFGDPLADLAIARLEIAWQSGLAAMDMFTREYLALRPASGTATLPLWDLRAALRACEFPVESWPLLAGQIASVRAVHRQFALTAMRQLQRCPLAACPYMARPGGLGSSTPDA